MFEISISDFHCVSFPDTPRRIESGLFAQPSVLGASCKRKLSNAIRGRSVLMFADRAEKLGRTQSFWLTQTASGGQFTRRWSRRSIRDLARPQMRGSVPVSCISSLAWADGSVGFPAECPL
jgi:hypothetical protein